MYAYRRDRRNLSSTGVSSSPLLSPSWKGSGQRPRRQSEGRPWSLIKPLHWPSLAGDGAHHETITWAHRWSGMITLDLIAGHVGVGSAEKRNHINWCGYGSSSSSSRRSHERGPGPSGQHIPTAPSPQETHASGLSNERMSVLLCLWHVVMVNPCLSTLL